MKKKLVTAALVVLPLAVGGVVLATQAKEPKSASYTCPITGEPLPCPNCCPLNK